MYIVRPQSSSSGLPLASEGEEEEEEELGSEEHEVPLMAQEACSVADDWTQSLLPLPRQRVHPSSGQSIRDSWPLSVVLVLFVSRVKRGFK